MKDNNTFASTQQQKVVQFVWLKIIIKSVKHEELQTVIDWLIDVLPFSGWRVS